jgi:hypothetical protein
MRLVEFTRGDFYLATWVDPDNADQLAGQPQTFVVDHISNWGPERTGRLGRTTLYDIGGIAYFLQEDYETVTKRILEAGV